MISYDIIMNLILSALSGTAITRYQVTSNLQRDCNFSDCLFVKNVNSTVYCVGPRKEKMTG